MTFKRRRGHGLNHIHAPEKTYHFVTNSKEVHYKAESLSAAKFMFQKQFGFWAEEDVNYVVDAPIEEITKGE